MQKEQKKRVNRSKQPLTSPKRRLQVLKTWNFRCRNEARGLYDNRLIKPICLSEPGEQTPRFSSQHFLSIRFFFYFHTRGDLF